MDANAHDVAWLYEIGINLFERLVSDDTDRRSSAGVAAASTYNQRGVMTPIPNEASLGLTRCTRIDKGSGSLTASRQLEMDSLCAGLAPQPAAGISAVFFRL